MERDGNAHVRGYVQPYTKWYDIAYGRGVALLLPDGLPAFLVQCESIPVCRFTWLLDWLYTMAIYCLRELTHNSWSWWWEQRTNNCIRKQSGRAEIFTRHVATNFPFKSEYLPAVFFSYTLFYLLYTLIQIHYFYPLGTCPIV